MNPDTTAQLRQKLDKIIWSGVSKDHMPDVLMQAFADYISQLELPDKYAPTIVDIEGGDGDRDDVFWAGEIQGFNEAVEIMGAVLQKQAASLRGQVKESEDK